MEARRWRQPRLWCPAGCLCARWTCRTSSPSAGCPSSSRSPGSGRRWCGSQTWCCPRVCISGRAAKKQDLREPMNHRGTGNKASARWRPNLSVQCDGAGLTLGADPLRPGRMALAARLDFTADVLQCCKLPSGGNKQLLGTSAGGFQETNGATSYLSAPPVSLRRYAWNDMCFTGGSRWFR